MIQRTVSSLFLPALLILLFAGESAAQMFSVGDERRDADVTLLSSRLMAGWERGDFNYQGETAQGTDRYDFNGGIFNVRFESQAINMYIGLAGKLTGLEERGYVNIGATIHNPFFLAGSPQLMLYLPLQINTDLKRVMSSSSSIRFQQSAFQFGAGLGASSRLAGKVHGSAQLVPSYGFSNSQGAFIGGSVFSLDGKVRVSLLNLFPGKALVLGYHFRYRSYDIERELFDYNYSGHNITIGVTL